MKASRSGAAGGVLEMELDMTKGSPFKLIVRFIIPIIIGNIFQQLYSLVDTVIVGRFVGVKALAADDYVFDSGISAGADYGLYDSDGAAFRRRG